jgi:hypothetical protein
MLWRYVDTVKTKTKMVLWKTASHVLSLKSIDTIHWGLKIFPFWKTMPTNFMIMNREEVWNFVTIIVYWTSHDHGGLVQYFEKV